LLSTQSRQNMHSKMHIIASFKQALDLGRCVRKSEKATRNDFDSQIPSGSCSASAVPAELNAESDIPRRRIPFVTGNCARRSSVEVSSSTLRPSITPGNDWLRVIWWKSAYLIFSVTVRPRVPVLSQ